MADYWNKKRKELEDEKKKASMDYWEKKEKELKEERKQQSKAKDRKSENQMRASASNVSKYTPSSYLQTLAVLEDLKLGGSEEERKKKEQEEGYKRRQSNTSAKKSEDSDIAPTPALMSSYGVTALKAQEDYLDLKAQKQAADQAEADRRKVMYSAALGDHSVQLDGRQTEKNAYEATKKDDLFGMDFVQKGAFTDGYQLGDVTKTILGTLGDAVTDIIKAPIRMGEGIGDLISYGAAGAADLLGYDEWAEETKRRASESSTDKLFQKQEDFLDRYSVLGRTSESIAEGVGQAATLVATGGLAGAAGLGTVGSTILTTGLTGTAAIGGNIGEAYQSGATDEEAALYGITTGTAEALFELLSGGLGKGVNAIGVGKGLGGIDDIVAEGLTRKINNVLVKNLTQAGVKATGEGLEEVLSGLTSAAMKKATYMNEEELSEILADENLLEQFVVGAMASGIMQGGDVISDTKAGRDMATGLNQTEQTVVDKLFEERLAEAEKDGKKLKGKDKTELYDGIVSDMEKGYLDKGKIEEILGGDEYTAWKDAKTEEDGKLAELEELRGIKESELTVGQRERYDELKAEVESWKSGTYDEGDHFISNQQSLNRRFELDSKVGDLVKDTKLTETWKQDLMKREAFSADLSTYKNKSARQTMENLVKSGVVNNSNRSHEMAQTLTNLSERKGYVFDFTSNAKLKASGMVKEGTTVNGYISKDGKTITVNLDSPKAWQFIVGHEITHSLEGTAEYKEFKTLLMQYAQGQEGWDNYWNRVENTFRTYGEVGIAVSSNADQMAGEITADLVGEYLFQDEAFVTELATKHRNVFQKIYDEIKHLIKMVTAGSKEAKDLERLHHAFEKAWAKGGSVQSYADTSVDTKPKVITEEDVADAEPVSMELTAEQEEYFKDSKVRDEDGNLKVMYHGTSRGGFTVFDPYGASKNGNLFGAGTYFTDDESVANGYTARGKGENKQVYKTYLNITNPIDMDALANVQEWEKAFPDADYPEVGTNEEFYRAMEEHMDGMEYSTAEAHEEMLSVLESMGYDGITHVGGDRVDPSGKKHRVYIAFRPEQIKAIDNARPTGDADIRYSLSTEQVSEHLRDVIENDPEYDYGHYGIRVDNYNYNEGDTVFNSHELYQDAQYDMDGELIYPEGEGVYAGFYDAGELDGASTIGINTDDPSALQKNISKAISNVGKYATHEEGDYVYLIRGDSSQGGSDIGESIISSPVVLKKYKINEDGTFDEVGTEIDSDVRFSLVEDQKTIDFLENQDYIVTYKSMQYIDGKLYPPMSAEDRGADGVKQLRPSSVLGRWQQADENPGNIKKFAKAGYGKYTLHKGNGKTVEAAYNPYEHSSNLVLNDQFEEAYKRPNLVTVECHIPVSELDGSYKAQYAKDATGMHDWKAGSVASKLKGNPRKVYLSRWLKPVRVLSDAEVAQKYKEILGDQVEVPFNVVSPSLLSELEKAGVKINYKGSNGYQSHERRRAEKAKGDVKFSLSDNAGRKLSDGQAKYFADSKVRDENGKLMVMYHGTPNGDFTVFRDGTYFTADKSDADKYQNPGASSLSVKRTASNPKTYEVYLNIKKPFDLSDPEARDIYINDYIKGGNAVGINPYLSDAEYAKISTIDWTEGEDLREFLQDNGYDYDGLVLDEGGVGGYGDAVQSRGTSYVVFSPEQVKNTDNLNPSGDRDIRFSLSKSVEETPELIAVHNLTGEKLMKSLKMGGMPMPSVAIAKAQDGHTEFGEISLILGKDSIDPQASRYNKVYGGDAWTPTYPSIEYKVNDKVAQSIRSKVDRLVSHDILHTLGSAYLDSTNLQSDLNRHDGDLVRKYKNDAGLQYAYLVDKGVDIELPMREKDLSSGNHDNKAIVRIAEAFTEEELKAARRGGSEDLYALEPTIRELVTEHIREKYKDVPHVAEVLVPKKELSFADLDGYVYEALKYHRNGIEQTVDTREAKDLISEKVNQAEYEAWLGNLFSGIVEKEGIRNNKDIFTPSGNRRGFDALHDEHTLDNVIRVMRASGEKGIGLFNGGNIFGASAVEYSTIDDVKKASNRLKNVPEEEYDAMRDDIRERLYDLAERFANHSMGVDGAKTVFAEAVAKYKTKSGIANYLKREGQGWATYSPEIVDDLMVLVNDIRNMPTGYFEAKPQRAVGFDEVGVFVIPYDADPKLKQELLNRGYSIAEYDPKVEGDRKRVVNSFEEYKFSLSDASDMDSRARGSFATPASDLAYHGDSEDGQTAPVAQDAPVALGDNVSEIPNTSADVAPLPKSVEAYQGLPDDTAPSSEYVALRNELDSIEAQMEELTRGEYTAETYATFERLVNRGAELQKRMDEITASADEANAQAFSFITDADAPPELEAPYAEPENEEAPPNPFENRDMKEVGNRSVKAYMYENPEVKPYFQAMANIMKTDLREGMKGEKWFNSKLYYETNGEAGWGGTTRALAQDLAELKDQYGYTYEELEKGVQAIIDDDGAENNAISKRLEFLIHDRLAYGYTDDWGQPMPEDAEYIQFIKDKAITEYNEEAKKQFFEVADQYAPPVDDDLAPMPQSAVADTSASDAKSWADEAVGVGDPEAVPEIAPVAEAPKAEAPEAKKAVSRKEVHAKFIGEAKSKLAESGLDFDTVLKGAKDLSTFATVDNTPQRVMEKALGYKAGRVLSDLTVNKVAQNETTGIRWLNRYTDRKSGVLAQISRQYRIKPGSKESAAAQMYAEGFYVNEKNEIIKYGESELAKDFPSLDTQNRIRSLATDPRIRKIYDDTLKAINESRTRNAYPEIPRLDNYFLHFRAMGDTFSRLGLPFNPNDIRAKDLPTDLNGVTADLKPGQPYFASAQHRTGKRTSFDLLGGLEMYLNSAKNQIYHIDDIQNLRAFRNYIADMYGQANGLEGLDDLGEAEQQERLAQVYGAHLSTFAKFLNEEANVIAGKTALIDRGLEGIIGRRGMTFLDSLNRQVGANMVGGNISSALTNLIAPIQAFAKTNKLAFIKGMAQFSSNKVASIFGKGDGFADQSPVMVRRNGIERFHRTLWQKMSDPGYLLMSAVDEVSTELIARAKYNEYTAKGMSAEQAHIEADKWTSRLMGDRSLGQQPQLYNSKMLGIVTKFQLEVRNQLDSQFYDTIQETKVSNEDIKNGIARNAKTAAQVTSTFVQLAVLQHIFGKAFESVAGYNPAFDIISAIVKAAGFDDEEEDEDTILDNLGQGLMELVEDLPYSSLMTGGRIPMASALPIKELFTGKDQHGNEKSRLETLSEAAPYYLMPGGYGQVKKALGGMDMFSDEHPIAGSYTDSGNLRFPVADTPLNRVQAGLFGQWASGNARDYFDGERSALNPSQTQEFIDSGMSIQDYWKYRDGMKGMTKNAEKLAYINSLPLDEAQKNALKSHFFDEAAYKEENPERYAFFEDEGIGYLGYRQLDEETQQAWSWAYNHQDKYRYLKENGVMPEDYSVYHVPMLEFDDEADSAFEWAFNNPEKAVFGKVFSDGVREYRQYATELSGIKASKDEGGKTISGSRKAKVLEYINSLDIDYGERLILFKREYNADDSYNSEIIDYLNSREDISFEDTITILRELGFTVTDDGAISWD